MTSTIEHKSVLDAARALEELGVAVTYVAADPLGRVAVGDVERALRDDTTLVSIMHVNNETGVIQDVAAIGALCRARGVRFHVDAAQSVGKVPLDLGAAPIDLCSLTAHKLCGPKGVGALYVAAGIALAAADARRRAGARPARGHACDASGRRHGQGVRARRSRARGAEARRAARRALGASCARSRARARTATPSGVRRTC